MAVGDALADWVDWCQGNPGVTDRRLNGADFRCIDFVYNNGLGELHRGPHAQGWAGRLFYVQPGPAVAALNAPDRFIGWGRAMPAVPIFSRTAADMSPTDTALPLITRDAFTYDPPFIVYVHDHGAANVEWMRVVDGTGAGPGSLGVERAQHGTGAVAHPGILGDAANSSAVEMFAEIGDGQLARVYDTEPATTWLHLEVNVGTQECTFRYHNTDDNGYPDAFTYEEVKQPVDGGQWIPPNPPIAGELTFGEPWWITYRKVTSGYTDVPA